MPTYVKKARGKRESDKKNRRKRRYRHTKEVGIQKILEVEKSIWEKGVKEGASAKDLGLCYRIKGEVCAEKEKGLLIVERGKGEDTSICGKPAEKRVYLIL